MAADIRSKEHELLDELWAAPSRVDARLPSCSEASIPLGLAERRERHAPHATGHEVVDSAGSNMWISLPPPTAPSPGSRKGQDQQARGRGAHQQPGSGMAQYPPLPEFQHQWQQRSPADATAPRTQSLRKALGQKAPARLPAASRAPSAKTTQRGDERRSPTRDLGLQLAVVDQGASMVDCVKRGKRDISQLLSWMTPRQRCGGCIATLTKVGLEIDVFSQDANAYIGGQCSRRDSLLAAAGEEPPPRDPGRVARAASLLLQLVRGLPRDLWMRSMLEPLALELVDALYHDWRSPVSLDELRDDEVSTESFDRLSPFFAIVAGHCANARAAVERATAAEKVAEETRQQIKPRDLELVEARKKIAAQALELERQKRQLEAAEKQVQETEENHEKFVEQTKYALQDLGDATNRDQHQAADIRNLKRQLCDETRRADDLESQVTTLTNKIHVKEGDMFRLEAALRQADRQVKGLPALREELETFRRQGAAGELKFAGQLSHEVLGRSIEELWMATRGQRSGATEIDFASPNLAKSMQAVLCSKLKALPAKVEEQEITIKRLKWEVLDTRRLIPVWNADAAEDLFDGYDETAPVHREVFSMKDKRAFAALGTGDHVPPYLRAEGFVRHVFISKAELEDFMTEFQRHLLDGKAADLTPEQLHEELFNFMRRTREGEALTEFAYAFICGLEAHRDDPDFELFDLMLTGAVHPSISVDQQELLRELQNLIRACQEGHIDDTSKAGGGRPLSGGKLRGSALPAIGGGQREQVSRRVIRAVLQAVFPDKSCDKHNALARALHMTLQELSQAGKSPGPDLAYISDLFSASVDGQQTTLIEEVRRQHYCEVLDSSVDLARRMEAQADLAGFIHIDDVRMVLAKWDPHAKPQHLDKIAMLAFSEDLRPVAYRVGFRRMRHGALLKPDRLWVKAQPKDVVEKLLSAGPPLEPKAGGQQIAADSTESTRETQPRRCRGAKVLDNPNAKLQSDQYNTPEGLQRLAMQGVQRLDSNSGVDTAGGGVAGEGDAAAP